MKRYDVTCETPGGYSGQHGTIATGETRRWLLSDEEAARLRRQFGPGNPSRRLTLREVGVERPVPVVVETPAEPRVEVPAPVAVETKKPRRSTAGGKTRRVSK